MEEVTMSLLETVKVEQQPTILQILEDVNKLSVPVNIVKQEYQEVCEEGAYDISIGLDHDMKHELDLGPESVQSSTTVMQYLCITVTITKHEFFEEWMKHAKQFKNEGLFKFITSKYDLGKATKQSLYCIKRKISSTSCKIAEKFNCSSKKKSRFLKKYAKWLQGPDMIFKVELSNDNCSTNQSGLMEAVLMSGSSSEDKRLNKHMKSTTNSSKTRGLTSEEALAYYVDSKSTINMYKRNRESSIRWNIMLFPSLSCVRNAMNDCCPTEEHILVNEKCAEIKVQAILDITSERLILAQHEFLKNVALPNSSLTLVSKWFGETCSNIPNKEFVYDDENINAGSESILLFAFVPLNLQDEQGNIIWRNQYSKSKIICRPMKFLISKGAKDFNVTAETNVISNLIESALPSTCKIMDREILVKHEMILIKANEESCGEINWLQASQKCDMCKLYSDNDQNFIEGVPEFLNIQNCNLGLSIRHIWVRCYECLLQLSFHLHIKKIEPIEAREKEEVRQYSDQIKERLKTEADLIFDDTKPEFRNNSCYSNARKFFKNPNIIAALTGLDNSLIQRFSIILQTLSSGYEINIQKFEMFALETSQRYFSLYPWHRIPDTVHYIFLHSAYIIQSALVPFGQLAEQALKARYGECRRFRDPKNRKQSSVVATNRDLLKMLLITTDPLICSLRNNPRKKISKLCSEVLELLNIPVVKKQERGIPNYCHTIVDDHQYSASDSDEDSDDSE